MTNTMVKLNVGGVKYQTSLLTLTTADPESMLARMVEQERQAEMIRRGTEIFIDRDGELFKHVLDYLRNPTADALWGSDDPNLMNRLKIEARDFFLLDGLVKKIDEVLLCPFAPGDLVEFKPDVIQRIEDFCQKHVKNYYGTISVAALRTRGGFLTDASDTYLDIEYPGGNQMCLRGRVVERVEGRPGCVVHIQLPDGTGSYVDHKWHIHSSLLCRV